MEQADINRAMRPWADDEIVRFSRRVPMFIRRGLIPSEAEQLADRLALRDQEKDTRRMCIECDRLQQDDGCFALKQGWIEGASKFARPIKTVLLRCQSFKWAIPK